MPKAFDPYHRWLSIPPAEQPPNHYRLLGLGLFEDDADVISSAADRQMAHVQTYKTGPHSAESQRLLNEIAAAKLCLLKPAKRAAYDADLRGKFATQQSVGVPAAAMPVSFAPVTAVAPAAVGAPAVVAAGVAVPPIPAPPGVTAPPGIAPRGHAPPPVDEFDPEPHQMAGSAKAILAGGSVLIVALIVAIIIAVRGGFGSTSRVGNDSSKPPENTPDAAHVNGDKTGESAVLPAVTPSGNNAQPPSFVPKTAGANDAGNSPEQYVNPPGHVATGDKPDATNPSATKTSATTDKAPTVPAPADPAKSNVNPPNANPANANPMASAPGKKLLVPDAAAQAAAEVKFAGDFAGLMPEGILEKSKSSDDAALVYVALEKAIAGASEKGDVIVTGRLVDELSRRFTIDEAPLRAKACLDLRPHVASVPGWEALASMALPLVDEVIAANHSELTLPLAETSLLAARKSGNNDLIRKVTQRVLLLQEQNQGK